jgi:hypothetical protein
MKNTIPFNLFGEQQSLCFTILGIVELEKALGASIQNIMTSGNAGFGFCLSALPICLKKINPHLYVEKIAAYLSEDDHVIDDIAVPIIHAIAASGALGKASQDRVLAIYYPELYKVPEDETEKNS